jgi:hypothetical protein
MIDDGMDEVYTKTTHRVTCAQAMPSDMPHPINVNAVVDQSEETKGQTQVGTLCVHKKISQLSISEFTTIGRPSGPHPCPITSPLNLFKVDSFYHPGVYVKIQIPPVLIDSRENHF